VYIKAILIIIEGKLRVFESLKFLGIGIFKEMGVVDVPFF